MEPWSCSELLLTIYTQNRKERSMDHCPHGLQSTLRVLHLDFAACLTLSEIPFGIVWCLLQEGYFKGAG